MSTTKVVRLIKDLVSTLITVAVVIGVGIAITGTWPFMVAVESGSMEPHMYRGDVVFLISPYRTDIVTWENGKHAGYASFGDYGDVIVYYPNGDKSRTPIIHRAMYWIEKGERMPNGKPAPNSGYITKGDHNLIPDQPHTSNPVKKEWIVGVAKFRIPFIGYFRLVFG
jgi:signal peptidase